VVDHLADNDEHALILARSAVAHLGAKSEAATVRRAVKPPRYPANEIYGLIPGSAKTQYDARELIARLVDDSEFHEFKALFGTTLVCGFAHVDGWPVGILANQGVLFSDSALKGTHFVELCCQRKIPMVFLQNITGFMVGQRYEHEGIAKHGAKMVTAVACAKVPKLTLIVGGSFGAGNYAMAGRAYDPRFLWMWPNSRISVMGGEMAASVLAKVKGDSLQAKGNAWSDAEEGQYVGSIRSQYDAQGAPFYASARLWDDGVIDPADSRHYLSRGLAACMNAPIGDSQFGVFRM